MADDDSSGMRVIRAGSVATTIGGADRFTGSVRSDLRFEATSPGRATGALVSFDPGARTHWHRHPLGQTLVVTAGVGWTQCEGSARVKIRAGDVVWCDCDRRHWHGGTATTAMTHFAVAEALDGVAVEWLEPVSDAEYLDEALPD